MAQKTRPVSARPAGSGKSGKSGKAGKKAPPTPDRATKDTPASVRRTPVKVQNRPKLGLAAIIIGIALAVVIAGVIAIIVSGHSSSSSTHPNVQGISSDAVGFNQDQLKGRLTRDGVATYDEKFDEGRDHRALGTVTYTVDPPAGGNHYEQPAAPGWYVGHDVPPDMYAVHSLEHGYVAIWVKPDLSKADMDQIYRVFSSYKLDVVVLPHASLTVPVAATVWHRRLLLNKVDAQVLADFVEAYRNQGPEAIPHNVPPQFT